MRNGSKFFALVLSTMKDQWARNGSRYDSILTLSNSDTFVNMMFYQLEWSCICNVAIILDKSFMQWSFIAGLGHHKDGTCL